MKFNVPVLVKLSTKVLTDCACGYLVGGGK